MNNKITQLNPLTPPRSRKDLLVIVDVDDFSSQLVKQKKLPTMILEYVQGDGGALSIRYRYPWNSIYGASNGITLILVLYVKLSNLEDC